MMRPGGRTLVTDERKLKEYSRMRECQLEGKD
jgi:hypothetical protein